MYYIYIHIYILTYVYVRTYIHSHVHPYIHTAHTYTYIHAHRLVRAMASLVQRQRPPAGARFRTSAPLSALN